MKKILIIILLVVFSFTSCNGELDLTPISTPSLADFFKNAADVEAAVNGAYDALQQQGQYGESYNFLMEVRSDNSEESSGTNSGGIFKNIDIFDLKPSNAILRNTWRDAYNGILRCNTVLERIDGIDDMDAATKTIRKGEVLFIRALTYFNLVRIFGDVPLITAETKDPFEAFGKGRDATNLIYTQIISDLTTAAADLPSSQNIVGKATSGATNALLGKVQLTLGNYKEAIAALENVTGYSLVVNYADLFGESNENNKESIFEIQYTSGKGSTYKANGLGSGLGEGSSYATLFAPIGGSSIVINGSTLGSNRPTKDLWNSYNPTDLRRDVNIGQFGVDNVLYPKKIVGAAAGNLDSGINAIVLRYADVLLMHAEALNELGYAADGQAFDLLNQIRTRAGLTNLTSVTVTNQAEFRLAIEKERRWEFAFENHRWFDLLRTGRALTVMQNHTTETANNPISLSFVKSHQLLYPIPQSQINANTGLIQNSGY
ncbi:MAG: RagB/SusD family nutrient uptake outer membrane protein [Polaribacter sp.]